MAFKTVVLIPVQLARSNTPVGVGYELGPADFTETNYFHRINSDACTTKPSL